MSSYENSCYGNRCEELPAQTGAGGLDREGFLEEEASKLHLEGLVRVRGKQVRQHLWFVQRLKNEISRKL